MSRKRPLSHEEWTQVGAELKAAQAALWRVVQAVQVSIPIAEADAILKVHRRIDNLKSRLDNHAHRQHPDWGPPNAVFYGVVANNRPPVV